jgi:prepilin-type N-terminal cleavage/methylation domain-containing protein
MVLNKKGFTLTEVMVVIAIMGILAATAIPAYKTWQQRIYGAEAKVMLNQIINAQIAYYLENNNNKYFGEVGKSYTVYHDGQDSKDPQKVIYEALHLEIPIGHFVDYELRVIENGDFRLEISVCPDANFTLFNGASQITAILNKDGKVIIDYL